MPNTPFRAADFDPENAVQGLRGCDAVWPFDQFSAYDGLHKWVEVMVEDRARLRSQLEAMRLALCELHDSRCGGKEFAVITKADIQWAYERSASS